nr:hypothetical protein [Hassalia byssoidea]
MVQTSIWFTEGGNAQSLYCCTHSLRPHATYATSVRLTQGWRLATSKRHDKHRLGVNLHPRLSGSVSVIARSGALPKKLRSHF